MKKDEKNLGVSLQSRAGLNAANFFIAEVAAVIVPFLSNYLKEHGWRYDEIGVPVALGGLGVLLLQTPAGLLVDKIKQRKCLFAGASLLLGACYGLIPFVPERRVVVDSLMFLSGVAQAFFVPLLAALALALVGYKGLNKTIGKNQCWNHAGNIAAALMAMLLVKWFALSSIFFSVAVVSLISAASVFLIRSRELNEDLASGKEVDQPKAKLISLRDLFRERPIVILFITTTLFHLANAPVMPMVALYIKKLGGSDGQVAQVVLVAQAVMIPVAWLTGWCCDHWGRKPIFAIAFLALPIRIFLYSLARDPKVLVALQTLDGIGAGVYGVAIVSMCSDLTRGKGRFNALMGIIATALCFGGVIGPIVAGFIEEHLGFVPAFYLFAAVAAAGAVIFVTMMPETAPSQTQTKRSMYE